MWTVIATDDAGAQTSATYDTLVQAAEAADELLRAGMTEINVQKVYPA